jgi:hypothetical protein
MGAFKATKPKARIPLCWECNKRLYGGGRIYTTVTIDGVKRDLHAACAQSLGAR